MCTLHIIMHLCTYVVLMFTFNISTDNDYHIKRRHIMFHHRLTRYQLFIGIVDDCLLEYDETFSVTAVPQTPQISCNATTRITIVDNDSKLILCVTCL